MAVVMSDDAKRTSHPGKSFFTLTFVHSHILDTEVFLLPSPDDREFVFDFVFFAHDMLKIRRAFSVDVDRAIADIFTRLAFRWRNFRIHEEIDNPSSSRLTFQGRNVFKAFKNFRSG